MKPSLPSLVAVLSMGILILMNTAAGSGMPAAQTITATPTLTPTPASPGPAGDTNGIAFLGILIFAVILAAIVIRLRAENQR